MIEKKLFNQPLGHLIDNWNGVEMPPPKVMQGNFCLVEPLNIDKHAKQLFENLCVNDNGEAWAYLPYGPFASYNEFHIWLNNKIAEDDTRFYVILNNQHSPVGIASYLRINPPHGVIEVGRLHYSTFLQRTSAATEAMYLMMKHAFDDLGYRRYEWKCNSLNEASKSAALRLGFQFEGIFRQSNVFKNRNRDTAWFSILDSEWPTIKEKFQRWLNPTNFHADGTQKIKFSDI